MEANLKQKLNDDLRQAMKDKDAIKTSTLRMLISSIRYAELKKQESEFDKEIAQAGAAKDPGVLENLDLTGVKQIALSDTDMLGVVAKEIKQREESIVAFKQGNRQDLVDKEAAELAVLKSYMPPQMTHDEIVAEAKQTITEVGALGPSDKGKVMSKLVARLKGKADGREINNIVTDLLSSL